MAAETLFFVDVLAVAALAVELNTCSYYSLLALVLLRFLGLVVAKMLAPAKPWQIPPVLEFRLLTMNIFVAAAEVPGCFCFCFDCCYFSISFI